MTYLRMVVLVLCPALLPAQMRTDNSISGQNAPKGIYALSFDDGPDEIGPNGQSETVQIAQLLGSGQSRFGRIPATFFMVPCHFATSEIAPEASSAQCKTAGSLSTDIIQTVLSYGHEIGNHSAHHLSFPNLNTGQVRREAVLAASVLAPFEGHRHLFRFPGFTTTAEITAELNGTAALENLSGPYAADFGGDGYINGVYVAGDYDCFAKMFQPETCADVYVRQIAAANHGGIILLHDRPEGSVGFDYAYRLLVHLLNALPAGTQFVSVRSMAQYQANVPMNTPMPLSQEFGLSDGLGSVAFGDLNASGKQAACKARVDGVWCALSNGFQMLPATQWLAVSRVSVSNGQAQFTPGQTFWLADVDGDGSADLVWEGPRGVFVALSNGRKFRSPTLWLKRQTSGTYTHVANSTPYTILLGDADGDGRKDLIFWTSEGLSTALSNGADFATPEIWSNTDFRLNTGWSAQTQVLRVGDLNGDGMDDVCGLDYTGVICAVSNGKTFVAAANWISGSTFNAMSYPYFTLADVAGDGVKAVVAMQAGRMLFSESTRSTFLPPQVLNLYSGGLPIPMGPNGFADWSGDGKEKPYWVLPGGLFGSHTQGIASAVQAGH